MKAALIRAARDLFDRLTRRRRWWMMTSESPSDMLPPRLIDAVLAEDICEAVRLFRSRNPVRPGCDYTVEQLTRHRGDRMIAEAVNRRRTSEIKQVRELCERPVWTGRANKSQK